jgi:hypothetical protein
MSTMSDDIKTIEIPTVSAERVVTPAEYMAGVHQVLQALDLPAELNGTHVSYGEMSDGEGEMMEPLMRLIDARFAPVRCQGEFTAA